MLPFLKNKDARNSGVIVEERSPEADEMVEDSSPEDAIADMIIQAIKTEDKIALVEGIKSLMDIVNSTPDPEPDSFDAQNILAGDENA